MKHLYAITVMICLTVFVLSTVAMGEESPTYAERLGFPEGARVVIFHNDDAGLSHESNEASFRGVEEGLITSWSVMMPCAWVPEVRNYLKTHPDTCSGLHLTLTAEWDKYRWRPLACVENHPGLADPDGFLWDNVKLVSEHASADEIEAEIRAQIAAAEKMGMPISHLDTHMGTVFATEEYLMRYVTVGIEKQIPVLLPGGHMTALLKEDPELGEKAAAVRVLAESIWASGLPVIDDVHTDSYGWNSPDKTEKFIEMLQAMKPGITQVIIHATVPSPNFAQISESGEKRGGDLNAMLDPKLKQAIEKEGILLTSWRELIERRKKAR
ncbi:MAG TPA: polysaccharide deacetylase family protein [Candidatus Hydrogenedentes bacterium]|nr:MAG: hypothetical protein BWX80_00985 [Candidatus Hydrogenedentes bacterium ADurb.Bin101]HOC69057.1 polysaccharide deacetylase family protein [Candidatus Hydrogenedentota bacterium]HQN00689.1 polysaccharide deacetylase family protein [Candidatus Hydrogenedentota bacterium]